MLGQMPAKRTLCLNRLIRARHQSIQYELSLFHADWATFYPMRLVLFPVLLPFFWREMTVRGPCRDCCAGVL